MGSNNQPIKFDLLDAEGNPDEAKLKQLRDTGLTLLKATLAEEEFKALALKLGLEEGDVTDAGNAAVIEKLDELIEIMKGAAPPPAGNEPPDEDRKEFIKKCIEEGGDMKSCADKYKEKYPDTPEMKQEEMTALQSEIDAANISPEEDPAIKEMKGQLTKLQEDFKKLQEEKLGAEVKTSVEDLSKLGHIAPAQVETVTKLAAKMDPALRNEYLNSFRSQKFSGFEDVGGQHSAPPGSKDLTAEDRARIIREQGLDVVLADASNVPEDVRKIQGVVNH